MSKWLSEVPAECDLCHHKLTTSFIDGKTVWGPWGIMCPRCHGEFGFGFGTGRGQEYFLATLEKIKG